ncbi:deaminase [Streptomyces sp. NPDC006235]|uniref:deoxycytidylate deaminase n=1 Tax=Streptomyces sp. NPDC006235 TaxID=3156736 RepID=UPI0033B1C667
MTDAKRPDWDTYFLAGAHWVATRADCTRSAVGAILVNAQREVRGTGYNGAPSGVPGCASAAACPRGRHWHDGQMVGWYPVCACGEPWPCPAASAPNSDYGNCTADHAERNAIRHSAERDRQGATLYTTRAPCPFCWTLIRAARIARVVCPTARWTLRYS